MDFGESLVQLKGDIIGGYEARKALAKSRESSLSSLRADVRQTALANARKRAAVSKSLAAESAALRERLAVSRAELSAAVQQKRSADRAANAEVRRGLAEEAAALRASLSAFRQDFSATVSASRAQVRSERAASASAVDAELRSFVVQVKTETGVVLDAVRDQLALVRGAWGHSALAPVVKSGVAGEKEAVHKPAPVEAQAEIVAGPVESEVLALSQARDAQAREIFHQGGGRGRKKEAEKPSFSEGGGNSEGPHSLKPTE